MTKQLTTLITGFIALSSMGNMSVRSTDDFIGMAYQVNNYASSGVYKATSYDISMSGARQAMDSFTVQLNEFATY